MPVENYRIFPLGDSALTVEFGTEISEDLNDRALRLAEQIDAVPFPGFIESVPAYSSTTVFFEPVIVRKHSNYSKSAFDTVMQLITDRLTGLENSSLRSEYLVEIPVSFGGDAGPDLPSISETADLSESEVISLFMSRSYRVYMLGFLPGFAYMGEVDDRLAVPRRSTPRLKVPKGSVGIAGRQTGIYPLDSPGGWQIIGRTDIEMFTPNGPELCRLHPGDSVKFVSA